MADHQYITDASLSTMWSLGNYPNLNDFFDISRELGFGKIELNHQVSSKMLACVNFDHYQFSSVHAHCPADISTSELMQRDWLVSSADEASRQQGVAIIEKSIDLAHQLSAPVVVIHCGSILTSSDHESKLRALFNAGQVGSAEFRQIKNDFQHLRQDLINLHLQPVKKSLGELIEYAVHRGISLGLENRYHYMDIPNPDEMEQLLSLAAPHQLGFIFDVGHAQALDRLGFYPHAEWLHRFALRMLGCHLHDVIGITDHLAPGLGEIDFASIAHFLPGKAFRTCELSPGNTLAQVKEGLGVLIESGCIKHLQ